MLFDRVSVIGLGGIWSKLWKDTCKTMTYTKGAPKEILLVDGDQFSFGNLERQDMQEDDEAKMKTYVYKERLDREFPKLKASIIPEFVTKKNIAKVIRPNTIVLSAVDNHKTRKLLADYVRGNRKRLKNVAVITGANDEFTANAHLHIVLAGKEITMGMDKCHPEIDKPADKNPGDLSCEERARLPGGGQTSSANMMAASFAHNYLWEVLKGGNRISKSIDPRIFAKSEVFWDSRHLMADSTSRAL